MHVLLSCGEGALPTVARRLPRADGHGTAGGGAAHPPVVVSLPAVSQRRAVRWLLEKELGALGRGLQPAQWQALLSSALLPWRDGSG